MLKFEDFEMIMKGQGARRVAQFSEVFARIARAQEDKLLIKAEYKSICEIVNMAIGVAFGASAKKSYDQGLHCYVFGGSALTEAESKLDIGTYSSPSVALFAGKYKKVKALKDETAYSKALHDLFAKIEPLVSAVVALKPLVGKKPPKTDPVLAYVAPPASQKAAKAVYDALEAVVDANYQALVRYFVQEITADVERFKKAQPKSIYDHTVIFDEHGRVDGFTQARGLLLEVYEAVPGLFHKIDPVISPDCEAIILKKAEAAATYQKQTFLYKNMTKMDSILERRGDFDRVEVVGQSLDLLEAHIVVFFKNGDRFTAKTQIVNVYDARIPFTRYPLTFHGVVMNGKTHAMFSEQEMNTIFAPAKA